MSNPQAAMKMDGPVCAIVTPFDDRGAIEFGALRDELQFLWDRGERVIVVNGTTGEFPALTLDERKRILEYCRAHYAGTVINNVSSCAVDDCIELMSHGHDFSDAVLLLPPFYFAQPSRNGLAAFFRGVIRHARSRVFLYNFPRHTQAPIAPDLLHELAREYETVVGIKDSGGDLDVSEAYKSDPEFMVFVGGDRIALESLRRGLDGSVTGGGSPVIELLVNLHASFVDGKIAEAEANQRDLDVWTRFRSSLGQTELAVVKSALAHRIKGFPVHVRPPLEAATDEQSVLIGRKLLECGLVI
ncbi:MAG: dihydrodipicolinate synthase family protein [Capsulimonadaceae bacterium]